MRILVKAQPGAKQELIERVSASELRVKVKARAVDGKANERLREVLAKHFKVSKSAVQILKGLNSKTKLIEITLETED